MNIDQAKIIIRPRTPWEAIDLGIALGRNHALLLIGAWFAALIPVYLLLLCFFWHKPIWIFIIIWWLKPIFDRIPLHILATAIFSTPPTIQQTLKHCLKRLNTYLVYDLIFSRISLRRSYLLPVKHLEGTQRKALAPRIRVFNTTTSRAHWLTIVFLHFESLLNIGIIAFIYFMIPDKPLVMPEDGDFFANMLSLLEPSLWKSHLSIIIYICVLAVTETLYVACGFCLYLNHRIILEGWDIELAFRQLHKRLLNIAGVIVLALGFYGAALTPYSYAAAPPVNTVLLEQAPIDTADPSKQAKTVITQILDAPPFYEVSESVRYNWIPNKNKKKEAPLRIHSTAISQLFSQIIQIVFWALVIFLVGTLLWHARHLIPIFRMNRPTKDATPPEQLLGLTITPESLPKDILSEFDKLWQEHPRAALSLLYRALLSQLVHQHHIPLTSAHTEEEVIALTTRANKVTLTRFTKHLTQHWQQLAYGHYTLSQAHKETLRTGWQQLVAQQHNGDA